MDKIVKYIDVAIRMSACTLRCSYCYLSQREHDFLGELPHFDFNAEFFRRALSKNRLGGVARINFCGDGETLLVPHFIEYVRELLDEGHWVDIVTNGTVTKVMQQLADLPSTYKNRLFLKISFHYIELKKRNLLETFFKNIQIVRSAGISFSLLLTGSDDYMPYIDDIKKICIERVGALPHISFARSEESHSKPLLSKMDIDDYYRYWQQFDSPLFDFQHKIFGEKRKEFCMAGEWTFFLDMNTGILRQCHASVMEQNIYENINEPIKLKAIGHFCRANYCVCGPIWLTLGAIPNMIAPTYAEVRDRNVTNGQSWLTKEQEECMSRKLAENNTYPTFIKKLNVDARMFTRIYIPKFKRKLHRLLFN